MSKPSDPESADSTPEDPTPIDPALTDPLASDPVPIDPVPIDRATPIEPAPSDSDFDLPQSPLPGTYYDAHGVPTFDAVRDRIEQISAQADGQEVLDEASSEGIDYAEEREKLDKAGKDRLAQIRKSMGL